MIERELIAEARELCAKATHGEWKAVEHGNSVPSHAVVTVSYIGEPQINVCSGISPKTANAAFIARSRTIIPEFCDALEQAQPQWTSVKDRLPEEHDSIFARYYDTEKWCKSMFRKLSDEVSVVLKFEDGSRMVTTSETHDGAWFLKSIRRETVTHWMKLPALPKEDADA